MLDHGHHLTPCRPWPPIWTWAAVTQASLTSLATRRHLASVRCQLTYRTVSHQPMHRLSPHATKCPSPLHILRPQQCQMSPISSAWRMSTSLLLSYRNFIISPHRQPLQPLVARCMSVLSADQTRTSSTLPQLKMAGGNRNSPTRAQMVHVGLATFQLCLAIGRQKVCRASAQE